MLYQAPPFACLTTDCGGFGGQRHGEFLDDPSMMIVAGLHVQVDICVVIYKLERNCDKEVISTIAGPSPVD